MKFKLSNYHWLVLLGLLSGCTEASDELENGPGISPQQPEEYSVSLQTRITEGDTAPEVSAGLYMVNYTEGSTAYFLDSGNYLDNCRLLYQDGTWLPEATIYWTAATLLTDFYAYAPYDGSMDNARNYQTGVSADQSTEEDFAHSDFLWGRIQGLSPTGQTISLTLSHLFSRVTVIVKGGTGFSSGELMPQNVDVFLGGSKTSAVIDLYDGMTMPVGTAEDIKCHNNGDLTYTAILVPQTIPFSNLIQVTWNGNPYTLQNSFLAEPKKQYTITVTLKKSTNGFNVGIDGWDILEEDFGGTVG